MEVCSVLKAHLSYWENYTAVCFISLNKAYIPQIECECKDWILGVKETLFYICANLINTRKSNIQFSLKQKFNKMSRISELV